MLPRNAQGILDLRLRGKRPADPLVVSFIGATDWPEPHVFCDPGVRYDWRFLLGLLVFVAVRPGLSVRDSLVDIFEVAKLYPMLVDFENEQIAAVIDNKPLRLWKMPPRGRYTRDLFDAPAIKEVA